MGAETGDSSRGAARRGRIEDYALIGDCETAALVGRDGAIDWLCWPRFDSDACFAALLGTPEHGRWELCPADDGADDGAYAEAGGGAASSRTYRGAGLVLETRFETAEGAVRLVDFMPPRGTNSDVVRLVVGERGRVRMRTRLTLRFGYGASVPWVTRLEDGALRAIAGPDMVVLRTPVPLRGEAMTTVSEFVVEAGETVPFVLTYGPSHLPLPEPIDPQAALADTERFWAEWGGRCADAGPYSEVVRRSLVTLKALTYAPTGGIVAAPTTSLPEWIGGPRNWDYRFCWLRDATLSLLALMNAGYFEEARAWRDWLLRAAAGDPQQLQIMYGLAGERRLSEWEVPWLPGFEGSRPVRVGNAAHDQLQIDVYGEIADALHQARAGGLPENPAGIALSRALLERLETIWREPDEGIWEVRGGRRHFTHSKVMAWVAFDRAVRSAEEFGMTFGSGEGAASGRHEGDDPVGRWRAAREAIHADVLAHGWNAECGHFVQSYGSDKLDASLLLIPAMGFLPPDDPRVVATVDAIARDLVRDGFVLRYDTGDGAGEGDKKGGGKGDGGKGDGGDGLPPGEGAFLACSFWLADAYVMMGRREEAEALFARLVGLANDVGLLSEEYDPVAKRQLGNFPQAFSHLALVNTAHNLTRTARTTPIAQRSGSSEGAERAGAG